LHRNSHISTTGHWISRAPTPLWK